MNCYLPLLFLSLLFVNKSNCQTVSIKKVIETIVDDESEPVERVIRYFDENGNDTLTEEFEVDSLVLITKTKYDEMGRVSRFSRFSGNGSELSDVSFKYLKKGKRKTLILISEKDGDLFSKELEIVNEKGQVIEYRINYVQEKIKSINHHRYDDEGREIAYESYDGKRLDFFVLKEYTDLYKDQTKQDIVISERIGLDPMGDDNLVYQYTYESFDANGNWQIRKTYTDRILIETLTKEIFY